MRLLSVCSTFLSDNEECAVFEECNERRSKMCRGMAFRIILYLGLSARDGIYCRCCPGCQRGERVLTKRVREQSSEANELAAKSLVFVNRRNMQM